MINLYYSSVLPYFRALESYASSPNQYRGAEGELIVSQLRNRNPSCEAWLEAAQQYGLPANTDFNGETTYGVGTYQLTIGKRWRQSSAVAFLHPVRNRSNLSIVTNAQVSNVILNKGRATGVNWGAGGRTYSAHADREIILSAGALQSPQLLQLSGIGPEALLRKHGIKVEVDASGVGGNLQDHYMARTIVRMNEPYSLNREIRNPFRLASMGLKWLFNGSGPMTVGAGQVGGAACSEFSTNGRPDVHFTAMPFSADRPGDRLHSYSGFTAAVYQCRPRSRGRVDIQSSDPYASPRISPNYLSEDIDRKTVVAGVKMLRDIYQQPAFKTLTEKEVLPGSDVVTDGDILAFARDHGGTVFHCSGTCRAGTNNEAVVDPHLKVHGIAGLRVIDASIIPQIPSTNINAATLMVGLRAAELVLQEN